MRAAAYQLSHRGEVALEARPKAKALVARHRSRFYLFPTFSHCPGQTRTPNKQTHKLTLSEPTGKKWIRGWQKRDPQRSHMKTRAADNVHALFNPAPTTLWSELRGAAETHSEETLETLLDPEFILYCLWLLKVVHPIPFPLPPDHYLLQMPPQLLLHPKKKGKGRLH